MKDKILKLKDDLRKLHNYEQDKIELKRIKDTLQMYVNIVFPEESDDWHSKIFNIQFLPHPISDGYLGIMIPPDKGEFQQGKQSLSNVIDLIIEKMEIVGEQKTNTNPKANCDNKRIFIVHGHDNETKESVARVLQTLGLEAIILNEKSNQGKTIIEKLEHYGDVGYAVVLLTPCDIGKAQIETEFMPRARQNVIAELGYFIGRLGRNRVSIIHRADTEMPSDFKGLGYISYNNDGSWKFLLARELKTAGYNIDANKII